MIALVACYVVQMQMTSDQLRESLGTPDHINATQVGSHTSEQWVYSTMYVSLEVGRISSWQTSR